MDKDDRDPNYETFKGDLLFVIDALVFSGTWLFLYHLHRSIGRLSKEYHEKQILLSNFSLRVTNLPKGTTAEDLRSLFSKFGEVYEVFLVNKFSAITQLLAERKQLLKDNLY